MKRLIPTDEMYFTIKNESFYKDVKEVFKVESGYISQALDENKELVYQAYTLEGYNFAHGYETFECAIIGLLAHTYDGLNSQADTYFLKMIDYNKKA